MRLDPAVSLSYCTKSNLATMFIDAREVGEETSYQYDLCVVGAGAAGIAIAMEFIDQGSRICILESGDLEYDAETQNLYKGESVGKPCDALDVSRLRFFGGATNHWGGFCLPYSAETFEAKPWIPHSGWPISRKEIAPHYERALQLLGLPEFGWNPETGWSLKEWERHFNDSRLDSEFPGFVHNTMTIKAVRMGKEFREPLRNAKNVDVFLNANAVNIDTPESGEAVRRIDVKTLNGGRLKFAARYFVLATGGIENARLLLASNSVQNSGIGNKNDLVGRYFADHCVGITGYLQPSNPYIDLDLYQTHWLGDSQALVWHEVSPELQKELHWLPASVRMKARHEGLPSLRALRESYRSGGLSEDLGKHVANVVADVEAISEYATGRLWHGTKKIETVDYDISIAPAPNPDSRVYLTDQYDSLGMPRIALDWRLTELDYRTFRGVTEHFASAVSAARLGRSKLFLDDKPLDEIVTHTWHHMCTTRMADDPKNGVVDRNCKVHGMQNLYIAGSSVFTTGGWGSPTMLIIALAQRLADQLKQDLQL